MKTSRKQILYILKVLILSILFYIAILIENPKADRLIILILIFIAYIGIGLIRGLFNKNHILYSYSYLIDIFLIYSFEYNSRFLINYLFHSFYIVTLLEISLTLKRKTGLIIGILNLGVSLIKYGMLIYYKTNLANISEMAFFMLINILILIVVNFAQYNKEEKEKKDLLYKELLNTHRELKEYSNRVEKLTKLEERNRIARDIHDTLGHNMTALIMQIEMSDHMMDNNIESAKKLLKDAKQTARQGLLDIRKVVETLEVDSSDSKGIEAIKELINKFSRKTRVDIELNIKGNIITHFAIDSTIYKIIQEALTNAVRHGKASRISVDLKYKKNGLYLKIMDNGVGNGDYKEGFGIHGMKKRVEELDGQIEILSNNGFIVKVFLPWR